MHISCVKSLPSPSTGMLKNTINPTCWTFLGSYIFVWIRKQEDEEFTISFRPSAAYVASAVVPLADIKCLTR